VNYDITEKLRQEKALLEKRLKAWDAWKKLEEAKKNAELFVGLENGLEFFEKAILAKLAEKRIGLWEYIKKTPPRIMATAPIIYFGLLVFPILHLFTFVFDFYIRLVLPELRKVNQLDYFIFQRSRLPYLNAIQKFNCTYCSYGNGSVAYATEIFSRTTEYPRKKVTHLKKIAMVPMILIGLPVFVLINLYIQIYQNICFPAYGIQRVKQGEYLIFNESQLSGLDLIECICYFYAVGMLRFSLEVTSRTESFWCPIKHLRRLTIEYHDKYSKFADYGDEEAFKTIRLAHQNQE